MEIDWERTLERWEWTPGATPVCDSKLIEHLCTLLMWAGENLDKKLGFMNSLVSLEASRGDRIDRFELATSAPEQILKHKKLAQVIQAKAPHAPSFECPFVTPGQKHLRYFKFQMVLSSRSLNVPLLSLSGRNIQEVYMSYHQSSVHPPIEVKFYE